MRKSLNWIVALFALVAWGMGFSAGRMTAKWPAPSLSFSSAPARGAFVPGASSETIEYVPPPGQDWTCLVGVVNDDPTVWHYKVWRDGDARVLEGRGIAKAVVIPQ